MTEALWDKPEPAKQSHALPVDVILFNMVDFSRIKSLPHNQDCTEILQTAAIRVLEKMFSDSLVTVEAFMPRIAEFQYQLEQELYDFMKGKWMPFSKTELKLRRSSLNDNSFQ